MFDVEIFTYGNGVMLTALFQAIAALTSTADYLELIRVIFVISTLVVSIEIVWTGRFKATGRLFAIILLLNFAILTTADVQLTDRVNAANSTLLADIPAGIAVPLGLTTAIGDWATGAFEMVFSMPNDLRYQTNGLLFASRLVEASTQFEITDARMANNLSEFAQGCIYYGIMADWFTLDTVMESGNIWGSLPAASFGNAIFVNYEDSSGNVAMDGCKNVRTKIEGDWATAISEMQSVFGQRLFPEYIEADAKARLISSLPQSYSYMATIASNAADIVRQNAMINTMKRSFTNLANNAGSPGAAQDYALAQAEAQQRTTYATLGAMAGRMMSLFSNVLETLIYGIFPIAIAFIMISLMQGKAILTYLKLLFWLQLWPPMFAILNFAMSVYAADSTTAAAMQAGGGASILNMLTYTGMRAVNSDMSAMAGYLSWMIPMFSWAIVSGSGFAASQMAASLGAVSQSSGSSAAGAVSSGNISLGNYSAYNGRMFQSNSSPSMSRGIGSNVNPNTGTTTTTTSGGMQFQKAQSTSMPFSANLSSALRSSVGTSATASMQAAQTAMSSFSSQTSSTYSNMQKLDQMTSSGQGTSTGSSHGSSGQFSSDFSKMDKLASQFGKDNNMSKGQAASMLVAASASTDKAVLGKMAGLATGMSGKGELRYNGSSESREAWSAAQKFGQDNNFGEKWQSAMQSGEKASEDLSQKSGDSQSKSISAGFSGQKSARSDLQSSMTQAQAWQSLSSQLSESGGAGTMAATAALMQYGRSQGHDMEKLAAQSASTSGNAAQATQTLQGVVSGFVQNEASKMAGVGPAPTPGNVSTASSGNQAAVQAATDDPSFRAPGAGNIKASAAENMDAVRARAEQAGVPSSAMVGKSANEIAQMADDRQGSIGNAVTTGGADINTTGQPIQQGATESTASGNQNHVVNATGQLASAGIDSASDVINIGKEALGWSSSPSATGSNSQGNGGSIVGGSSDGQGHHDLPPASSEGTSETTPKAKGAWVNRLD